MFDSNKKKIASSNASVPLPMTQSIVVSKAISKHFTLLLFLIPAAMCYQ